MYNSRPPIFYCQPDHHPKNTVTQLTISPDLLQWFGFHSKESCQKSRVNLAKQSKLGFLSPHPDMVSQSSNIRTALYTLNITQNILLNMDSHWIINAGFESSLILFPSTTHFIKLRLHFIPHWFFKCKQLNPQWHATTTPLLITKQWNRKLAISDSLVINTKHERVNEIGTAEFSLKRTRKESWRPERHSWTIRSISSMSAWCQQSVNEPQNSKETSLRASHSMQPTSNRFVNEKYQLKWINNHSRESQSVIISPFSKNLMCN